MSPGCSTQHCVKCHGGEKGSKGGLDLDDSRVACSRAARTGPAIVPGKSAESLLVKSIRHEDKDIKMPKKEDKLPDGRDREDRAMGGSRRALREAARRGQRPRRKGSRMSRRKTASFGHSARWRRRRLRSEKCGMVRERRLIVSWRRSWRKKGSRRIPRWIAGVTDPPRLISICSGLPPTPEQVEQFRRTTRRRTRLRRLIDELLASPHYGERWGRHWLDLARYAESHGYEQDYDRPECVSLSRLRDPRAERRPALR